MITKFKLFEDSVKSFEKDDIYRDSRWVVVRPLNQRAAMKYGANTNWCTATSDPKYMGWYNNEHSFFIYIIDRSKTPPSLDVRNAKIKRYQQLYNDNELDSLDDKEDAVGIDMSRIAILIHWENPESEEYPDISMYDANNIDLYEFDYYGLESLDIPENVKGAIGTYIDNWVKSYQNKMALTESLNKPLNHEEPQENDYILAHNDHNIEYNKYLQNHIGQIYKITSLTYKSGNKQKIYNAYFDKLPLQFQHIAGSYKRRFTFNDIDYWSPNKADLEQIFTERRFDL